IVLRFGAVDRTSVPEAPIDENGDLARPEDDVGPGAAGGERPTIHSIAKTAPVKNRSQKEFRSGVTTPLPLETFSRRRIEWSDHSTDQITVGTHASSPPSTASPAR